MTAVMQVHGLNKAFGGLQATDNVSFDVREGEVHAIIGPNGAGKTTLISQLFGEMRPDSGHVRFEGADITRLPPYRRTGAGMARSFQVTTLAQGLSVMDHALLAVMATRGHAFRLLRPVRRNADVHAEAHALLDAHGLADRADAPVSDLSHGEQRVLELALALAAKPRLLLLDEPMAGLGTGEGHAFIDTLLALKGTLSIILVEHDMGAVFRLADRITVLVGGAIAAQGTPDEIRANEEVRRVYLGTD